MLVITELILNIWLLSIQSWKDFKKSWSLIEFRSRLNLFLYTLNYRWAMLDDEDKRKKKTLRVDKYKWY